MTGSTKGNRIGKSWAPKTDLVPIWNCKVSNTRLEEFQKIVEEKYNKRFDSYWEFHRWTVDNCTEFWGEMWHYLGIIASRPYDKAFTKTGPKFFDNEWFSGALFNYAENILRYRDDSVAIEYLDEHGNEDRVTFAEMFEEVKLYAAAFRKNGLKKGDTVACCMSHRKEAIFAMLATTSIGAIWGGPPPYFGAKATSIIVTRIEPKFLITVDSHFDEGHEFRPIDFLPLIVDNAPTLEKVILVVTQKETLKQDLSIIRNCVLLEDFLEEGRTPSGDVSDIVFEQLPPNHPVSVHFTSGTTGQPKGIVHSAETLIAILKDFAIHHNMRRGDVIGTVYPVGWNLWDWFTCSMALGCRLFLFCGSMFHITQGMNYWDKMAKYNVKLTYVVSSIVDKMEKRCIVPNKDSNMEKLEMIIHCSCAAKKENFNYLKEKVNKNCFIGSVYGSSEVFAASGFNLNLPANSAEIQVPSLGMDIQCFNTKGESVVAEIGEVVLCKPGPNFPLCLWKDENHQMLKKNYLSKYPDAWSQYDEGLINPDTNGIFVICRSDDTLKQQGDTFKPTDIYFAIYSMDELEDYICVSQTKYNRDCRAILFVKLKPGLQFTPQIKAKIEQKIAEELWESSVPELILPVPDIPYNFNNKRLESAVRTIVQTNQIPEVMSIKNPVSLQHFLNIPEIISYNQE